MWIREHSKFYPDVFSEAIWKIWVDINNWPSWHGDLDYCKLVAKHVADTVPDEMDSLVNLARNEG